MLNYFESIGIFHVRVGNRNKIVKGSLGNYIKIEHYNSLATYITAKKKHLKKLGLDTAELCLDENYFESNKKKFIHPNFSISFEHIFEECWIVSSYSKKSLLRLFMKPPIFEPDKAIQHINDILLDYKIGDKIPKYRIDRFETTYRL